MPLRSRYRNPIKTGLIARLVIYCILTGALGGGFVWVRNEQVKTGDQIRQLENELADLESQAQLWQIRVASAKDRVELAKRLKWSGSDLQPIDPQRVLQLARTE